MFLLGSAEKLFAKKFLWPLQYNSYILKNIVCYLLLCIFLSPLFLSFPFFYQQLNFLNFKREKNISL